MEKRQVNTEVDDEEYKRMVLLELDEKTAKELEDDKIISKAMDDRKISLKDEKEMLTKEQNKIMIRLMEIGTELDEYKEEY